MQDLQGYDLHKWLSSSPSSKIEISVSKGLAILGFFEGYKPPGYKISGLQWRRNKSPSAKSRRVFKLRIYLSTDKVFESLNSQTWLDFHYDIEWLRFQTGLFKCLIASMAGFLLWLSVTNIMIEVFKVALAQWLLFSNGYDLFYNERNSPESLQAYNPALGGYIIYIEITSNMQVPCHCQHAPWHLGANVKTFFCSTYWRPDSSHSKWAGPWGLPIAPVNNSRYTSFRP